MPSKRSVLEELTLDELRASLDCYDLEVPDRRVRVQLIDALARSRRVQIADSLCDFSPATASSSCAGRLAWMTPEAGRRTSWDASPGSTSAPVEEFPPVTKPPAGNPTLEAALLLDNLLARLDADAGAERPLFRSVVSDAERDALRALLKAAGSPRPSTEPVTQVEPAVTPPKKGAAEGPLPAIELNTDALRLAASPTPAWVLCLDFGTAKSKAFAATGDEEEPELEPVADRPSR